jgi:ubiquinone/menaquinone biosynthesis C-methylase UbiE
MTVTVTDMTDTPQRQAFLGGEGDAWFRRNQAELGRPSALRDRLVQSIEPVLHQGDTMVEVGCGTGVHLNALCASRGAQGRGIDPAAEAIAAGSAAFPALDLRVGAADTLPFEAASADLLLFGFCLYLVDRTLLWRCVAEADRVLKPRGWLAILDFDPARPVRRPYHHQPGLWSWKMDHSRLFTSNPAYHLAEKWSASHSGLGWHDDSDERVGFWLLRKDATAAYADGATAA